MMTALFFEEPDAGADAGTAEQFARAQHERKNYGEAFDTLQALLELQPDDAELKELMTAIWKEMNGPSAPETPEEEKPEPAPDTTGDLRESIGVLQHVIKRSPDNIDAREKLARLYEKGGDILNAAQAFREIARLYERAGKNNAARESDARADALMGQAGGKPPARPSSSKRDAMAAAARLKKKRASGITDVSKGEKKKGAARPARKKKLASEKKPSSPKPSEDKKKDDGTFFTDIPMTLDDFEKGLE
jgi:tetratricopeptide (TPR) repeat protein